MFKTSITIDSAHSGFKLSVDIYGHNKLNASEIKLGEPPVIDFVKTNILFVHANGMPKELWEPVIQRLLKRDTAKKINRIITFDSFNQGNSSVINSELLKGGFIEKYTWIDNARDVLAVVRQLGLSVTSTIVVGHSFGATSALIAETMSPLTFKKIICADPVLKEVEESINNPKHIVNVTLARKNGWNSKKAFLDYIVTKMAYKNFSKEALDLFAEYGIKNVGQNGADHFKFKTVPEQEATVYAGNVISVRYIFNKRHLIQCPIIIIYGEKSLILDEAHSKKFVQVVPDAKVVGLKNLGHLLVMEDPEQVSEIIFGAI